jgi:hypothetical protein
MEHLFNSGLIVDIALGFIALEFVFLILRVPAGVRRDRAITLLHALGPGVCLMLAVRCALIGAPAFWVAFWIAASLPLHLWDVISRRL